MGLISPTQLADGTTHTAADHNNPTNTIANEFNGNIDNANIKAGAAIDGSKLAAASIAGSKLTSTAITSSVVDWTTSGGIWWQELGRTTLGSPAAIMTVSGLTARKYLKVLVSMLPSGGAIIGSIYFNNDTAANYAASNSTGGGADGALTGQANIVAAVDSANTPRFAEFEVINILAQEKLVVGHAISQGTAGGANAPLRREINGKWANTAAQITRVDVIPSTNSFAAGSEVIVLGHD